MRAVRAVPKMSLVLYLATGVLALRLAQSIARFSRPAALILLILPLLFTGRALVTGGIYGPVDLAYTTEPLASVADRVGVGSVSNPSLSDVYAQFIPWNDALRRAIRRGEWPLWNRYEMCGTPLAGAAQAAPYHPITIAGLLVPLRSYPAYAASMLYLLAALGAFLLAREMVASEIAALVAAIGWFASTHILFFTGTALGNAVSVTPLVLLGARRVVREPGRRSGAILTSALLLLVLSGHPESALHVVSFGVAYAGFEIGMRRGAGLPRVLASGIGAGLAALLLSAIFLLPHLEAIRQSEEYIHRALGYRQQASTAAQMLHGLRANAFPFLEGAPGVDEPEHGPAVRHGWLATAYAGSLLFAPALYGLWRGRGAERWYFAGACVWGLGSGLGAPGFVHLFNHLPGLAIAVNDRMIAFAAVGMAMLAALGVDAWLRAPRRGLALTFGAIAIAVFAAAWLPSGVTADYRAVSVTRALLPVVLAIAAILVLQPRSAAWALLVLLLVQRAGEAHALQPTLPARAFYPEFPGLSIMRATEPFRIVGVGSMLPPALSTHYGLEDVRGFQALTFARYEAAYPFWSVRQPVWSNRVDNLHSPFLSLMNVRFALVPPDTSVPPSWVIRASYPAYRVVENTRVLPRAFVPANVQFTNGDQGDWVVPVAMTVDFGDQSFIETGTHQDRVPNGPGEVEIEGNNRFRAAMKGDGWVVVSIAAWKGWSAKIDGRNAPIRFANHAFIGVWVPAGEHTIELTYRPRSFVLGAGISLVTALICLAGFRARP